LLNIETSDVTYLEKYIEWSLPYSKPFDFFIKDQNDKFDLIERQVYKLADDYRSYSFEFRIVSNLKIDEINKKMIPKYVMIKEDLLEISNS
jgi:hypothetical protein